MERENSFTCSLGANQGAQKKKKMCKCHGQVLGQLLPAVESLCSLQEAGRDRSGASPSRAESSDSLAAPTGNRKTPGAAQRNSECLPSNCPKSTGIQPPCHVAMVETTADTWRPVQVAR